MKFAPLFAFSSASPFTTTSIISIQLQFKGCCAHARTLYEFFTCCSLPSCPPFRPTSSCGSTTALASLQTFSSSSCVHCCSRPLLFGRERERERHTHTHTHTHTETETHTHRGACVLPYITPPHTHTHAPGDAAVHNNCDAATVVLHHEQTRQAHQLRHRPCGECVPYRSTSTAKQRKSLLLASHTHRNTSEAGASSAPLHSSRLAITNTRLPLFSPPPQKKIQPTALWFSKVQLPWTLAQFFLPYNTQAWVIHLGIFSCASQIGQERGQERSRERSRDREREIERETDTQALTRGMLTRTAC